MAVVETISSWLKKEVANADFRLGEDLLASYPHSGDYQKERILRALYNLSSEGFPATHHSAHRGERRRLLERIREARIRRLTKTAS